VTSFRTRLLVGVLWLTAFGAGCGAAVPANPTWEDDIRPLLVARCVRCHSPGGGDPGYLGGAPGVSFDYATYDAASAAGVVTFMKGSDLLPGATADTRSGKMPPPPAARLADWQIETLDRWLKNPR